jgi:hypothetical protein
MSHRSQDKSDHYYIKFSLYIIIYSSYAKYSNSRYVVFFWKERQKICRNFY